MYIIERRGDGGQEVNDKRPPKAATYSVHSFKYTQK